MASETWHYAPSPMVVVTTIIGLARGLGINAIAEDKPANTTAAPSMRRLRPFQAWSRSRVRSRPVRSVASSAIIGWIG
jgi:hypothetical protein